jgi:replicative DNA helicase
MKISTNKILMNAILESISSENALAKNALTTGISDLDILMGGWQQGVTVVSARPNMGLTAFALSQVSNVLSKLKENQVVIYLADKESSTVLMQRLLSIATQIDLSMIHNGKLKKDKYDQLLSHPITRQLKDNMIVFLNTNMPSIHAIRNLIHTLKKEGKKSVMLFVDSFQSLVDRVKFKSQDMEQVMLDLNLLSEEYELPVLCTMPLGRGVEYRESKYPRLSDLDAKMVHLASKVLFLIRPDYYDVLEAVDEHISDTHLIVSKNEGALGTIGLSLNRKTLTITAAKQNTFNNLTSS